ncbi:MAG: threonyl-tRNA synthetase editing domain-containing protein [Candidatus Bathyarchaeia archaeon]
MRMLLIHGDFKYRAKERVRMPVAEEAAKEWNELQNALIVFTCIEEGDEKKSDIIPRAANEIATVADRVKTRSIVLYPYAHLSDSLASPSIALGALRGIGEQLGKKGYKVTRSPFGWYKEFVLTNYGHALAESFRTL